jgi:integrase
MATRLKTEFRFSTKQEMLILPVPEKNPATYTHLVVKGFGVRVMKKDLSGNVLRTYIHRYNEWLPNEQGELIKHPRNEALGPVRALEKEGPGLRFDEAMAMVLNKRKTLEDDRSGAAGNSGSPRLTVGGAWAHYSTEKRTNREETKITDTARYNRYLKYLENRYLDELQYPFWSQFAVSLEQGVLVVGQKLDKTTNAMVPSMLGPMKPATLGGVLSTAGLLYTIANDYRGLRGVERGFNPPLEAKAKLPRVRKKTSRIALADLGTAWRASDQLVQPWWRDMFRVYVLTGLRRSLVVDMRFDHIDFQQGLYIIDPRRRGTKRRGNEMTEETEDIILPFSKYVLALISARREFAPDKNGSVWHTPKPPRGNRTKDEEFVCDPRYPWQVIEAAIGGVHFSPQDLRRTFSSVACASSADPFSTAMLMLHTGKALAEAAQAPGITIEYMNTNEAVDRKHVAAEIITAYVLDLASRTAEDTANIPEPVLSPLLVSALAEKVD